MRQPFEQELIGRMQAGDSTAVSDLASTYGPRIHQLAFRYLKNWEDAEEVTQDVLMKVHRKIDAFRGDAALSSWIYRITFNTAMSRLRNGRFSRPHEVPRLDGLLRRHRLHLPNEPADLFQVRGGPGAGVVEQRVLVLAREGRGRRQIRRDALEGSSVPDAVAT